MQTPTVSPIHPSFVRSFIHAPTDRPRGVRAQADWSPPGGSGRGDVTSIEDYGVVVRDDFASARPLTLARLRSGGLPINHRATALVGDNDVEDDSGACVRECVSACVPRNRTAVCVTCTID